MQAEERRAERSRSNATEQLERNVRRDDPAPREVPAESRKDADDDSDDDRDEQAGERRKVRDRGER